MPLNRDELQALAEQYYDHDAYDDPDQKSFAMLVDLAGHIYQQYMESGAPNIEDPDSFTPQTLGGIDYGKTLVLGLIENLEMNYPDGVFR